MAYQHHLWQPLFDMLAAMSAEAQAQTAPVLKQLLAQEGGLESKWQPLIAKHQLDHLFLISLDYAQRAFVVVERSRNLLI